MGNKKLTSQGRYFPAFFFFARARRSVFFLRLARFLALSLPLLFPISPNTHPLALCRHVVVLTKTNSESTDVTSSETEAGACVRLRRAAVDVIPAPIRPELS